MTALEMAHLAEVDGSGRVTGEFAVQFNPASLRMQMTNSTDGGKSRGRQVQQHNGSGSTTLTVDLEFDTADEGEPGAPVDVRTLTDQVRRFVLPAGRGSKQAPPRVRFRWGRFLVIGVMDQLTEEHDFFSPEGVPLRSKLSVQVKEQDPRFEALERGAGANPDTDAPAAGEPDERGADPGGTPSPPGSDARTTEAQEGETPADLLTRSGADPAAWRAVAAAAGAGALELPAGAAIDFSPTLSIGGGVGASVGFSAEIGASVEVRLGLHSGGTGAAATSRPGTVTTPGGATKAGFALSAAGGLTAAVQQAATARAASGDAAARAAFDAPPAPAAPVAAGKQSDLVADRRAATYGSGVPLRGRVRPLPGRSPAGTWTVVGPRQPAPASMPVAGRGAPPWEALPPVDSSRATADAAQDHRTPHCGCHVCHPLTRRFAR